MRVLAALAWCIQRARQASFLPPYFKIIWVCVCRRACEATPLGGSRKVPEKILFAAVEGGARNIAHKRTHTVIH